MKKLHSIAFYALVTPVITLASASVLAQQTVGQNIDREQEITQRTDQVDTTTGHADQSAPRVGQSDPTSQTGQSTPRVGSSTATPQSSQGTSRVGQTDSQSVADRLNAGNQTRMEHRGYVNIVPARGMQSSDLIGAEVATAGDEDVGSVDELIIDENGQVVAIVVGVGGFLGMGEKDVAIGWGHVTRSGTADNNQLRIDVTREDLRDAPEYERPE